MTLRVLSSGPQATLQAMPRTGQRHLGVPASGAMDPLSYALANRLVGNPLDSTAIEVTLGGFEAVFECDAIIAITGAEAPILVDGAETPLHQAIRIEAGRTLCIGYPGFGCRSYLAIAGGLTAETWLGSGSTYLPAGVGGCSGRALKSGDVLKLAEPMGGVPAAGVETPEICRPAMTKSWALRAIPGSDASADMEAPFFEGSFTLSNRTSRMGGALDGVKINGFKSGAMPSAAVFSGTVQCPPDGRPFLLMADAQTTGGYPLIAQVIRADRHLMGQIRPGDRVRFLRTTPEAAADVLREKRAIFDDWLEGPFHLG